VGQTRHMSQPTADAELRPLLEELLSLTNEGLRTVATDTHLAVTHGWFMRAVDAISATLTLIDAGRESAVSPLIRSAMEHAVGMLWLREVGEDGLVGLDNAHQRWANNIRRATSLANEKGIDPERRDWSPEIQALVAELAAQERAQEVPGEWRHNERFEVAKQFDLYVAWLSETATSHATQSSATPYLTFSEDRVQLLRLPRSSGAGAALGRCALVALIAFRAMGDTLNSAHWLASVDRIEGAMQDIFERMGRGLLSDEPGGNWLTRHDRRP
jgi:hypothetical protein